MVRAAARRPEPISLAAAVDRQTLDDSEMLRIRHAIAAGADLHAKDSMGNCALINAAFHGHFEIVRLLLEAKADPDVRETEGMTALHWAVRNNKPEGVALLLKHGASCDIVDDNGDTPLLLAVMGTDAAIVRALLDAGAALDTMGAADRTALEFATDWQKEDMREMLAQEPARRRMADIKAAMVLKDTQAVERAQFRFSQGGAP